MFVLPQPSCHCLCVLVCSSPLFMPSNFCSLANFIFSLERTLPPLHFSSSHAALPLLPLPHSETTCTVLGLRALWPLIMKDVSSLRETPPSSSGLRISSKASSLSWYTILYRGRKKKNICSGGTNHKREPT